MLRNCKQSKFGAYKSKNATLKIKWDEAVSSKYYSQNTLSLRIALTIAIVAIITFTLDTSLHLGGAGGIPYNILILADIHLPKNQRVYLLATSAKALTVLGLFKSPPGGVLWVVLINRGLTLYAIRVTGFFIIERIKFKNTMRRDQEILEQISEQRSKTLYRIEQGLHDFMEVGAN